MIESTEAYARTSDPASAQDAAARVRKTKLEQDVFEWLLEHRGVFWTSIEVAEGMGIDKWSVSPRFRPLERKGLVEQGEKLSLNSSGQPRVLRAWRAIPPAPVQLALFGGDA